MPMSVTGTFSKRRPAAAGFSLLEILVVLLLMGIILTMATLSMAPLFGRRHGDEATRLAAITRLASDQAILQGVEHGLELARNGYRILVLDNGRWLALDDDPAWRPRRLPDGVVLHLESEGHAVALPEELRGEPQLILFSSGENTPFEIEVRSDGRDCLLRGDGVTLPTTAECDEAG